MSLYHWLIRTSEGKCSVIPWNLHYFWISLYGTFWTAGEKVNWTNVSLFLYLITSSFCRGIYLQARCFGISCARQEKCRWSPLFGTHTFLRNESAKCDKLRALHRQFLPQKTHQSTITILSALHIFRQLWMGFAPLPELCISQKEVFVVVNNALCGTQLFICQNKRQNFHNGFREIRVSRGKADEEEGGDEWQLYGEQGDRLFPSFSFMCDWQQPSYRVILHRQGSKSRMCPRCAVIRARKSN